MSKNIFKRRKACFKPEITISIFFYEIYGYIPGGCKLRIRQSFHPNGYRTGRRDWRQPLHKVHINMPFQLKKWSQDKNPSTSDVICTSNFTFKRFQFAYIARLRFFYCSQNNYIPKGHYVVFITQLRVYVEGRDLLNTWYWTYWKYATLHASLTVWNLKLLK